MPNLSSSPNLVGGYPSLAQEMGLSPDIAILRRFATLNLQNLLYRQAEIIILEQRYRELEHTNDAEDATHASNPRAEAWYSTDWYWLGYADPENEQWKSFLHLRKKVEEYGECVLVVRHNDRGSNIGIR